MDLKCFSAPRAAKQQQQLAEVQAIEPLLSGLPAPPAFAQFLSPWCRSATNALLSLFSEALRAVTCARRSWRRRGGAARAGPPGAAASAG